MQLLVDISRNLLRLQIEPPVTTAEVETHPAMLDVGEGGQLVGLSIDGLGISCLEEWLRTGAVEGDEDGCYLALGEPTNLTRSAEIVVRVVRHGATAIAIEWPRRGPGYEISTPSGNR